MSQDLRKMFEGEREKPLSTLKEGHRERFLERLNTEIPLRDRPRFHFVRIAATILVLVCTGILIWNKDNNKPNDAPATTTTEHDDATVNPSISLGDLSPDLKKVEQYYLANINLELAQLQVSKKYRNVVDGYMSRLADLNDEYLRLNQELNQMGPNEQTITALIKNLQLRLQLLYKLKEKLNELKTKKNETVA
ncbi:hypothetical protein K8352_09455 [Flavobacteriaceae bacterium F89]|uniref:Uncharacterized protein n=1 Tax=Cerina litoralis TaxID=2874477 RepID=A0AAE3EWG4_9FLAO|nr:hypothetical protein [Cerina litoralis]MCG2460972.1 hypothetical protein [Cerina litoralis]